MASTPGHGGDTELADQRLKHLAAKDHVEEHGRVHGAGGVSRAVLVILSLLGGVSQDLEGDKQWSKGQAEDGRVGQGGETGKSTQRGTGW